MINRASDEKGKVKKFILSGIIFLVLLSWLGSLDTRSNDYVDGAILQSTAAFAVARATNAIISTLQSTTVSMQLVGGVSVTVGEVLDPINDLVEQYATLMKLSIASLVVQKVLLEVVSDGLFKLLFTVSGGLLILSFYLKSDRYIGFFFKTFVFLAFLRFILVVTVLLNGAVSARFIEPETEKELSHLGGMEQQLKIAQEAATPAGISLEEQTALLSAIEGLQDSVEEYEQELAPVAERMAVVQAEIDVIEAQIDASYTTIQQLNPFNDDEELQRLQDSVTELEQALAPDRARANQLNDLIADALDQIASNQNALSGQPDSMTDRFFGGIRAIGDAVSLNNVVERIQEYVPSIINVMTYFVLQTLIMPLIFLFLLSKGMSAIWAVDLRRVLAGDPRQPLGNVTAQLEEIHAML